MSKIVKYKANPFLDKTIIKTRGKRITTKITSHSIVENDTGQVTGVSLNAYKQVDKEEYVKVYTRNIGMIFELSNAGMKVFNIVLKALQKYSIEKDTLYLNMDRANEVSKQINRKGLAKASFYNGIKELIERQILAKSTDTNLFFINPNIIFNGDRVTFMSTYERRKIDSDVNTTEEQIPLDMQPNS